MPLTGAATVSDSTPSRTGFNPTRPWRRSARVGLRPEPFGALAYHFDTRRLVFLKSPELVDLVDSLAGHASAEHAVDAAVAEPRKRSAYMKALASLAESGIIEPAPDPAP